jgi:LPS export ABC transporter protein LptC
MISRMLARTVVSLVIALLAAAGCGRQPAAVQPEEEQVPAAPTSLLVSRSTIRVAAPDGRWRLEARSQHIEAASINGPYTLTPADCRYEQQGKPPVLIRAERASVDTAANHLQVEGSVRLVYGAWSMETDHLDYDLDDGKVVASGPTKLTVGEGGDSAQRTETPQGEDRP